MNKKEPLIFYVAPEGCDEWSGQLPQVNAGHTDGPFASLVRARNAIRQLKYTEGLQQPIDVLIRGGTYYLAKPFHLSAGDSGTVQCPISYQAYQGENPILSGGRSITGWQPYQGKIICTYLPDTAQGRWWFRQLFYNNKRLIRARWPKQDTTDPLYGGWAFIDSLRSNSKQGVSTDPQTELPSAFCYEDGVFPHHWNKPQQAEIFVIPGLCWISDIIPVKDVDYVKRIIRLTRPVCPSSPSLNATYLRPGNRFYIENNLEDLTQPGEWCLDTDTGMLYLWPPDDDPESAVIVAPVTARLIQMSGNPALPLKHVTIKGLTFCHTLAQWPASDTYYKTPNAGQTVYLENTEDCSVEDNVFDCVGGDAIRMQQANKHNRITGNTIFGAGANGIFVGSRQHGFAAHDLNSGDLPSPSEWHVNPEDQYVSVVAWPRSDEHLISNNHIYDVGRFEKHAHGIVFYGVSSVDTIISHNLIHDIPRFGIGLLSGLGRVIIEYNDLYNLSRETADTGGICFNRWYVYDKDPDLSRGCIVRFNRIRDVVGCGAYNKKAEPGGRETAGGRIWMPYYGWAIYFDNAPMNVLVYGNICARNTLGGIMISHWGRNVTVENNIFVNSDRSQVYLLFAGKMSQIRFHRNIFTYSDSQAFFLRLNLGKNVNIKEIITEFDNNLYSPPHDTEMRISGLPAEAVKRSSMEDIDSGDKTMADWRAAGFDRNSIIADPRFADPEQDTYDLRSDSPALQLGFQPIDTSMIGLCK